MSKKIIALAGNPNSGKTTLFNNLTGSTAYVGAFGSSAVLQALRKTAFASSMEF